MDSVGQFSVFILCVVFGYCGGLLYEVFALFRLLFGCERRENIIGILLDVAFFCGLCNRVCAFCFCAKFPYATHIYVDRLRAWRGIIFENFA